MSVSKQLKLEEILETLNSGRLKSDTLAEIEHDWILQWIFAEARELSKIPERLWENSTIQN